MRRPARLSGAAGLFLLIGLAACRTDISSSGIQAATPALVSATSPTPPAVAATSVADPGATGVVTAPPPPSPTSVQTSTPVVQTPAAAEVSADTPTAPPPPPTFTPPPPPPVMEGQQLWLQRPVPLSGPAWTDKAYPYGSTRGGRLRPHTGVEFVVPTGTPVLAVADGTVLVAGDDSLVTYGPTTNFYGNLVILELDTFDGGNALFAVYGHLSEVHVVAGQAVTAGDVLGLSGASGVADGPHLHFEVRAGLNEYGATRNPLLWLAPLPQTGVVAGRVVGSQGELLHEAPITLIRVDASSPYTATTSYALGEPNADSTLGENFALDDVVPGYYQAVVEGDRRFTTELWVFPDRVNWVELIAGP